MPTAKYFNRYPDFPSDVATANLPRISLGKLTGNDDSESSKLFQACKTSGFFLLDLSGSSEGETALKDAEAVFDLGQEILDLKQEELMKYLYRPPESLFGYKCTGQLKLEDGSSDRIDFYTVGQDDMLGTSTPRSNPELILANRKTFQDFFHHVHGVVCHLFYHLDKQLDLPPGTLASLNPQDKISGTSLRMLRCLPQPVGNHGVNLLGHTDIGSITMLFNIAGGLQVLPAGAEDIDENWRYVRPEPGCALINLRDTMAEWSGGLLQTPLHRVTTPPGQQAGYTRYSLAYLVRPNGDASVRRLGGGKVIPPLAAGEQDEDLCAREWETKRAAEIISGKKREKGKMGHQIKV
ncbi:hypothetical protein MMC30_008215 [Trapelia coarctata]|nr:hypothetical protein [Trapelia coarctata]